MFNKILQKNYKIFQRDFSICLPNCFPPKNPSKTIPWQHLILTKASVKLLLLTSWRLLLVILGLRSHLANQQRSPTSSPRCLYTHTHKHTLTYVPFMPVSLALPVLSCSTAACCLALYLKDIKFTPQPHHRKQHTLL